MPEGVFDATLLMQGFRVGDVLVEPRREQVSRDGEIIHLEPRVMQVLVELAMQPHTVLSRDHLLTRVWADAVVGDEVLSRAVSLLRNALGDDRTNPRYIRTVPRQGYELIANVTIPERARPAQGVTAEELADRMLAMITTIATPVPTPRLWLQR